MKKFNWVDAVIILLVVAIAAGGYWFLAGRKAQTIANTANVDIYVTVEIEELSLTAAEGSKSAVGKEVILGATSVDRGVVHSVEYEKEKEDIENVEEGTFVTAEYEDLYTAYLTFKVPGTETETSISSPNEEYHIGEKLIYHGKGFAGEGYVVGLTTERKGE